MWLARRGWRVTAGDISVTALGRAAELATTAGVADHIDFQQHDLTRSFPVDSFSLVSAQYLQSPVAFAREQVLQRAASAVACEGLLLIVDHGSAPSWSSAPPEARFPAPEELLSSLELAPAQWRAERLESPIREATGPSGQTGTVTDTVVALRRRAP